MTEEQKDEGDFPFRKNGSNARFYVGLAGVIVAIMVALILVQWNAQRAENARVDDLYCTLSGVSPDDPACAD